MAISAGISFGHYEVLSMLGIGAQSSKYRDGPRLGLHDGAPYIVAELREGEELRAALMNWMAEMKK